MALSRMDDFRVAIDPRTGELRSAARPASGPRGLTLRRGGFTLERGGFNWRPLAIAGAVVLLLVVAVFAAAVVSELL